jgi:hypothetical protein
MNPQFLTLDEVMDIHRDQIERYGGTLGVRDLELLESAIAALNLGLAISIFTAISSRWHRPISFTWSRTIRFSTGTNASGQPRRSRFWN